MSILKIKNILGEWVNIVTLKGDKGDAGADGREIELRKTGTHIQWRYVGDGPWANVVALTDITGSQGPIGNTGADGREIQLRVSGGYIQWQYTDGDWTNLIALSELQGPIGETGAKGDKPSHRWIDTSLQLENPDGSWGDAVNLKGASGEGSGDMHTSIYDTAGKNTDIFNYVDDAVADIPTTNPNYEAGYVTSGTGAAYTVEIPGITELKNGTKIKIIPHITSATTHPTLNVNDLGAKGIRRRSSFQTAGDSGGNSNSWISYGTPIDLMYHSSYENWLVTDITQPSATDLSGVVPINKGGTGAITAAQARTNLNVPQKSVSADTTLTAANWSSGRYTYSNAAITATNPVELLPRKAPDITTVQLKALQGANIVHYSQVAGSVTFQAMGDVPTIDIPVTFIIRGDL